MDKLLLRKSFLVLSVIIMCTWAPLAHALEEKGSVSGFVIQGVDPVVDAKVVLSSDTDSSFGEISFTNDEGFFIFLDVPLGGVDILVYDSDEELIGKGLSTLVQDGESIIVDIVMLN